MDEDIIVMNKFSVLYYVTVRCLGYTAEQTVCQILFARINISL